MAPIIIVCPFSMNILICQKLSHFVVAGIWSWLLKPCRQILLKVRVDELVAQMLKHLHFAIWPFV